MVSSWSAWAGVAVGILAAVLSAVRLALNGFTGGRLHRLEVHDQELAARLARHLAHRDECRVMLRLLEVLAALLLAACLAHRSRHAEAAYGLTLQGWLSVLAAGVLFLLVTEGLGRHLPPSASAALLVAVLPVVSVLRVLTWPLSFPVLALHRWARRWRDSRAEDEADVTAEDEILSLLDQEAGSSAGEAAIEADERRMIRGVLDLDEMTVSTIMTPRVDVDGIDESATLAAAKALIVSSGHSRIPVYHDTIDHIVGIVHAKDLLDEGRAAPAAALAALMHPPMFIPESKRLGDLLKEFQQSRNHIAVVLDEYGGTAGIVTIEDILEEIVGDIRDEYDGEEAPPATQLLPDGAMLVDARTTIDAVNEALGAGLPENDGYDTVGGHISAEAGRIPEAGETITTSYLTAEIIEADPRRILKAKVRVRSGR